MKKKIFVYLLMFIVVVFLQMTLADHIAIGSIKPNVFLTFIVLVALLKGSLEGVWVGLLLGIIYDCYSPTAFGVYMLFMTFLGIFVGTLKKHAFKDNYFVSMVVVFLVTLLYEGIVYFFTMLTYFWDQGFIVVIGHLWDAYKQFILFEALYNLAGIVILQFLFGKLIMSVGERDDGFGGELTWQK